MKDVEQVLQRVSWRQMGGEFAAKPFGKPALLAGVRSLARSFGVQLTKRKALQTLPAVGALAGALLNGKLAKEIGLTAYMCYRRRWLAERRL